MFCTQNDPNGQTSFQFLNTKTFNPLLQYSTALNVCSVVAVFFTAVVLIDLRYTVLLYRDAPMDNADKDATDYFRGIVRKGEKSSRALELTETIIRLNPAHYSAWYVPLRLLVSSFVLFTTQWKGNTATKRSSPSPPLSSMSSSSPTRSLKPPPRHTRSGTTDGFSSQPYATPCQN